MYYESAEDKISQETKVKKQYIGVLQGVMLYYLAWILYIFITVL